MESKESYYEKMRRVLDDINIKISELELKMDNASKAFREKYRPEIEDLKDMKRNLEEKLKELKGPAKEAWGELRTGLDKAAVELNVAFKRAFEKFNKQANE